MIHIGWLYSACNECYALSGYLCDLRYSAIVEDKLKIKLINVLISFVYILHWVIDNLHAFVGLAYYETNSSLIRLCQLVLYILC